MTLFRRLITVLAAVILAAVLVAFLLPREVTVSRTVTIDAPAEAVWPKINSLEEMASWSPWLARDPETVQTFTGPESGVGATMAWQSDKVGSGTQEIVESVEHESVVTALDFDGMGTALADLRLAAASGGGTDVTWTFDSDMGWNPMMRWMGLMMDRWVGSDYERGLAMLKTSVEGG